jgi:predicted nucleic acid-binding protein
MSQDRILRPAVMINTSIFLQSLLLFKIAHDLSLFNYDEVITYVAVEYWDYYATMYQLQKLQRVE